MGTYIGLGHPGKDRVLSYMGLGGPGWVKDDEVDVNPHAGREKEERRSRAMQACVAGRRGAGWP